MKNLFLIALLTIVSAVSHSAQNPVDERELINLDKEWSAAIERGDRDALNRIYADDFTARGGMENKAQAIERNLKSVKEDKADVNLKITVTPFDYAVKFKSDQLAVMTHNTAYKGEYKGRAFADYGKSLHVWVKRNGRWQVVAAESSDFTVEQTLMQTEREWGEAYKNKDKAWFERAFTDEFTSIGSSGKMLNKTEEIAEIMSDSDTITSEELSDTKVRVYGDTAVITGRLHSVGKDKDGNFDRNYSFTDTFVKRDGRWQVIASQLSLVKP